MPTYRPRPSALHAARPAVALGFCAALMLPVLVFSHPVVLGAAAAAALTAAGGARVLGEVGAVARLGLWFAALVAALNPLVASEGTTVLVRGYAVLGHRLDITLEELAYGLLAGLRVVALLLVFALVSAAVDPDALLRLCRRFSYRSALTAVIATRLVPALARDSDRRSLAARCRPQPPTRTERARAALSGSLDRAVDVAAALEVRGFAAAAPARGGRRPWSRHDRRVAAAALGLVAAALGARAGGVGAFAAYPELSMALGVPELALAGALVLGAAAPFAGAAARLGVARA